MIFKSKIIGWIWARIGPYFVISSKVEQQRLAMKWHRGMFKAFVKKDQRGMKECLRGDLESAAKLIIASLKSSAMPMSKARGVLPPSGDKSPRPGAGNQVYRGSSDRKERR